ncbi:hypothetical protein B0A79_06185 [Flavobacterium piscis]|uniref:Uncharacterized protein n=1 Tax=Flavobacterium piscis TaxID=1114874 RepID=A0ABX2XBM3_9FLAO|nr:hypothetical protein FLP_24865 [Flavobacterium piscis]OXG06298.1 hypothetical protein B0A79_06185 [Flavobacterium piscis]
MLRKNADLHRFFVFFILDEGRILQEARQRLREFIMKTSALALIEAVSFYVGVHHKRYKWIAGLAPKY